MPTYLTSRILLTLGALSLWWYTGNPITLLMVSPLFGALWTGPLIDGISAAFRGTKRMAMRDLEQPGRRLCAFRGHELCLDRDGEDQLWFEAEVVRKFGVKLPAEALLPAGALRMHFGHVQLRADLLAERLCQSAPPESVTLAFGRWLQRELKAAATRRAAGR
ncbi:hypothetical protein LRH25_03675 [Ideonella azotifigens]|nr:hypothetical protein [Ideonella azotifigens]MCD2339435.1 hypothetical protein [Ideonella azotifigens]